MHALPSVPHSLGWPKHDLASIASAEYWHIHRCALDSGAIALTDSVPNSSPKPVHAVPAVRKTGPAPKQTPKSVFCTVAVRRDGGTGAAGADQAANKGGYGGRELAGSGSGE